MARGSKIWFNGTLKPENEVRISLYTHGLHYGTGAFEGIRAYRQASGGGAVFRLREHMTRFLESAKIMDLPLPYSLDELCAAVIESCRVNGFEECYIRPLFYISDNPQGLSLNPGLNPNVDVAIMVWEWGRYLGDKAVNEGTRLKTSTFMRPHVNSIMTKGKITGQYSTGVLAKREAIKQGFDEAIFVDTNGYLTEGTGENLFMVRNGVIRTSPPTAILKGITRASVIEYFEREGRKVVEAPITRDDLWCADEVFLTGTAAEITPAREIDGRLIGPVPNAYPGAHAPGSPGPVTQKLQSDYHKIVKGQGPEYSHKWLSPYKL